MISGVHASHRKGRELAVAEREECTSVSACLAVARIAHRSDDLIGISSGRHDAHLVVDSGISPPRFVLV